MFPVKMRYMSSDRDVVVIIQFRIVRFLIAIIFAHSEKLERTELIPASTDESSSFI